jgi:hypothetical protein
MTRRAKLSYLSRSPRPSAKRVSGFAIDSKKAVPEHEIALKAFSSNRERLKAERLAREAAGNEKG